MMKRKELFLSVLIVLLLASASFCASTVTFSDTSGVGASFTKIITWLSTVLGAGLTIIGLIITGIRLAMHDEQALKKGIWVIVGGIIIFIAPQILKLIQSFGN
ncbi:MAG: TrbC/VirB2 family protein [Elusimicrobiota bacterium]